MKRGKDLSLPVKEEIITMNRLEKLSPKRIAEKLDISIKEIDILLEDSGKLYPMEIKKTATPQSQLTRVFNVIDKASLERGTGAVLCTTDRLSAFDSQNLIVPIWGI